MAPSLMRHLVDASMNALISRTQVAFGPVSDQSHTNNRLGRMSCELLTSVAASLFPVQTHRLSSRVVYRLAVRRPAAPSVSRVVCGVVSVTVASRRASSRCSASVASCAESCRSVSLRCAAAQHNRADGRREAGQVARSSSLHTVIGQCSRRTEA